MLRVLVIDDDESVRGAIDALLRHKNCEIVLAENARHGVRAFQAAKFDLVLIDIFMPGINGLDAIRDFRRVAPELPIVAMSGFRFRNEGLPKPDFLKIAVELGATQCLSKPFGPEQLFAAVEACLSRAA